MTFEVPLNRKINSLLPLISKNYKILHFDEFSMLYTGKNQNEGYIIGSLMCEDVDNDLFRYLHLVVKSNDYFDFINNKLSYRELITHQENVFLIDKNFDDEIVAIYCISVSEIPSEFLPHFKFFCPID